MGVNVERVFDGDVGRLFVKSGLRNGRFCHSLGDYDKALNVAKAFSKDGCVERE